MAESISLDTIENKSAQLSSLLTILYEGALTGKRSGEHDDLLGLALDLSCQIHHIVMDVDHPD